MIIRPSASIAIGLVLSLLSGCGAKYVDVSTDPMYAHYAKQVCVTSQQLEAQGIAVNYERARGTDYVMVGQPLAVRSYTMFVRRVQIGTRFNVLSARRCTNCPFDDIVEFRVKFEEEPMEFEGKPVYMRIGPDFKQVATCGEPHDPD